MFVKCLVLFLYFLGDINAQFAERPCLRPHFEHGRFRMRQKSKLIKFICFPRYQLVGNKYATCRDGEWDVPIPVCVRSGCPTPDIKNGVSIPSHGGAWAIFFCLPGHELVGSSSIFCDGKQWNATIPSCVDTTSQAYLSCDFEEPKLCGWTQDELHDFDWERLNRKTPSSFLFTGPSFDHTRGEGGNGYYMFIESTSKLENETARLLSPIYRANLAGNGCFSFWYHMYGKTTGGLRVYQKPESVTVQTLLTSADRSKYILFEKWGDLGDIWFNGVSMLKNISEDFQIVIEGIRGTSYTSDIAIDDVAILQGENCTVAIESAVTPAVVMPDSCAGRCDLFAELSSGLACGCTFSCVDDSNCCPDYFEVCMFEGPTTETTPADLPQTQKLVAPPTPTRLPPPPVTVKKENAPISTTTTTLKPPAPQPTTAATTKATQIVVKILTPTTTIKTLNVTKKLATPGVKTTSPAPKKNPPIIEPDKPTDAPDDVTIVSARWTRTTPVAIKKKNLDRMKFQKEQRIEAHRLSSGDKVASTNSSGAKTAIVTIASLLLLAALVYAVVWSRGAQGRVALHRLRGRTRHDPDVRYLHTDVDDDD